MKYNLWQDCPKKPITELLSFIVDNRGKTVPTTDRGWKLIATNCVTNTTLFPVYEKIRYLSEETYKTWFRAHPKPGDILFVIQRLNNSDAEYINMLMLDRVEQYMGYAEWSRIKSSVERYIDFHKEIGMVPPKNYEPLILRNHFEP